MGLYSSSKLTLILVLYLNLVGFLKGSDEHEGKIWLYEDLDSPEEIVYMFSTINKLDNQTEPVKNSEPQPNLIRESHNSSSCNQSCKELTAKNQPIVKLIEPDMSASFLKPSHHVHRLKPKRSRSELPETKSSVLPAPSLHAGIKVPFLKGADSRVQLKKNVLKFLMSHNKKLTLPTLIQKNPKTSQTANNLDLVEPPSTPNESSPTIQSSIDQFFQTPTSDSNRQPLIPFTPAPNPILPEPPQHVHIGGFPIAPTQLFQFNRAIQLANPAQFLGISPPRLQMVQAPHQPLHIARPFDQNAAQSIENYQRIRFNNNNNNNNLNSNSNNNNNNDNRNPNHNDFPMFLNNIPQSDGSDPRPDQVKTDSKGSIAGQLNNAIATTPIQHNLQSVMQTAQPIAQQVSSSTQINTASAAAMLSEKARNLLSQMNLGTVGSHAAKANLVNSILNARPTSLTNLSSLKSQNDNPAMSSMIKTAAEAWAASTSGADSNPAIIVEHDGPSITTVDFGNNQPARSNPNPPEDDEVSAFYAEENEETESEGSNVGKKIIKLRQNHQHPFEHQVDSHNVQSEAPLDSAFFESLSINRSPRVKRPQASDGQGDYLGYQRLVDRTNSYPDSINAIKQRESNSDRQEKHDFVSSVRDKLVSSSDDQIEKLIRELKELNKEKKGRGRGKKFNDDEDDQSSAEDNESDQIRLLKKKLMARLKSKTGEETIKKETESKSFSSEAIKIPLHALLLAALDRRMSSSERNPTVSPDLIADERNRGIITAVENQFNDIPASLDLNPIFGTKTTFNAAPDDSTNSLNNLTQARLDGYGIRTDYNGSEIDNNANRNMFINPNMIHESIMLAKHPSSSQAAAHDQDGNNQQLSNQEQDSLQLGTTRTPIIARPQRTQSTTPRSRRSQYPMSDLEGDDRDVGDFDVNKQIKSFAHDRNDPALEPVWVSQKDQVRKTKSETPRNSKIEFDDDFNDDSRTGSDRKILKRRRPSPGFSDNGERNFFDALRADTTEDPDVDRKISDINDGSSENTNRRQIADRNDDDRDFESENRADDEGQSSNGDEEVRKPQTREAAESKTNSSTWKPHAIDEEVRKIEESASKSGIRPRETSKNDDENSDYEPDDENDSGQKYEDTSESRYYSTTVQPGTMPRLAVMPSDNPQPIMFPSDTKSTGSYIIAQQ